MNSLEKMLNVGLQGMKKDKKNLGISYRPKGMAKIGAFHWGISSSRSVIFCKLMDPTDRPKLKNALNEKNYVGFLFL